MLIDNDPLSLPAYTGALPAVVVVQCGQSLDFRASDSAPALLM